jgi:methylenetetrahydrofolate reductase (NADPH)
MTRVVRADRNQLAVADSWDEFPNGRWGDSRSPAYGDLDGYPVTINISVSHLLSASMTSLPK